MSARFQAIATIAVGALLAALGVWWAATIACCSGLPRATAWGFAALGLAIAGLGAWSLRARPGSGGFVRRHSLWATIVILAVATALLAHSVIGLSEERTFAMTRQEGAQAVLRFDDHPDYFLRVDDPALAAYVRGLGDGRVEATFELAYSFGSLRAMRLVRLGDRASPAGFAATTGARAGAAGPAPWK